MARAELQIRNISKEFNGATALNGFSCTVKPGELVGLMGPNGAGKTTLFNIITGYVGPDAGRISFGGVDLLKTPSRRMASVGVTRTFQLLRIARNVSVLDNVLLCFTDQPGEYLTKLFLRPGLSRSVEKTNRERAVQLLERHGLGDKLPVHARELSYGQQKLLSLVCCLASDAHLFLLDEPVAGVAPVMIDRILETIASIPEDDCSVILIEHNIEAIRQVCDRVMFLDAGILTAEGSPEEVCNSPEVIESYFGVTS